MVLEFLDKGSIAPRTGVILSDTLEIGIADCSILAAGKGTES